jgi:hypothetical protein
MAAPRSRGAHTVWGPEGLPRRGPEARRPARAQYVHHSPCLGPCRRPVLQPAAPVGTEGHRPRPSPPRPSGRGARSVVGVTPRQACPRPEGLGRNLRSKTRWFAGFCNSHQVSHFATFFIDGRAEISVAESHLVLILVGRGGRPARGRPALPSLCVPWRHVAPGFVLAPRRPLRALEGEEEGRRGRADGTGGCPPRRRSFTSSRSSLVRHRQ